MTLPILLPAWIPSWLPFLILALGVLYLLVFLLMPFSVFGLKGRLEGIEARLDEIQAEMRRLTLRLPELPGNGKYEEEPFMLPEPPTGVAAETRCPPIPPAPQVQAAEDSLRSASRLRGRPELGVRAARVRAEPRLDWPQ